MIENKINVKKLIFVSGFNNYLGINEEYDTVNYTMYLETLEEIKKYCPEIIYLYSDNDPYVSLEKLEEFASSITTNKILIPGQGHLNAESGYTHFEDLLKYI